MQVSTKLAKLHTVVFSADDIKSVVERGAQMQLGLVDKENVLWSASTVNKDGSMQVDIAVADPVAPPPSDSPAPTMPVIPQ